MVLGEAAAAVAGGAANLFGYNRQNFMYDRKMRQEQEFQIMDYRNKQAGLWREDVRDLVGLTEKKMDTYLIVNALQLGFCVSMFAEGRLEAGTPEWLLRLYMLTLAGAFMFLLMSVWLAMHASVVAKSSEVRLLTQMVRLPVPSWAQIEATRTYGKSFEGLSMRQMMRMPFVETLAEERDAEMGSGEDSSADPWHLERKGGDIYELANSPVVSLRHIQMLKVASMRWQCFDAFARVSMHAGTTQMCFALSYYCLGYVLVQDGAPWAAWTAVAALVSIILMLLRLDISMTSQEHSRALVLVLGGPIAASIGALTWSSYTLPGQTFSMLTLPFAFASHGVWLVYFARICGVQQQPCGAWLPTKFRSVLYLDVFGWWVHKDAPAKEVRQPVHQQVSNAFSQLGGVKPATTKRGTSQTGYVPIDPGMAPIAEEGGDSGEDEPVADEPERLPLLEQKDNVKAMLGRWQNPNVQGIMEETDLERVKAMSSKMTDLEQHLRCEEPAEEPWRPDTPASSSGQALQPEWLKMRGFSDFGTEMSYYYHPESRAVQSEDVAAGFAEGATGKLPLSLSFTEMRLQSLEGKVDEHVSVQFDTTRKFGPQVMHNAVRSKLGDTSTTSDAGSPDKISGAAVVEQGFIPAEEAARLSANTWHSSGLSPSSPDSPTPLCGPKIPHEFPFHFSHLQTEADVMLAQTDPRHFDSKGVTPLRPEDVDLHRGGSVSSACKALRQEKLYGSRPQGPIKGIGPRDVAPDVTADSFAPSTYFFHGDPSQGVGCSKSQLGSRDLEACTEAAFSGHEQLPPGETPWLIFRRATQLLAVLWGIAAIWSLQKLCGFHDLSVKPLPAVEGLLFGNETKQIEGQPNGIAGLEADPGIGQYYSTGDLDVSELLSGETVFAEWPHKHFAPRAMSCDPSGNHFVVADDFGVFAANLRQNNDGGVSGSTRQLQSLAAKFTAVPPCDSLEGQALKDVGVVCRGSGEDSENATCNALVLHRSGRRLAECPLSAGVEGGDQTTYEISDEWLGEDQEQVESVAVNNDCHVENERPGVFTPNQEGCVVVGTSSGRVIQLRQHRRKEKQLVPKWTLQEPLASGEEESALKREVGSGSLHVFPGGYLMSLKPHRNTVQALDAREGTEVGEWRLPGNYSWSALCGGGTHLYVLGRRDGQQDHELWRFSAPSEITRKGRSASTEM